MIENRIGDKTLKRQEGSSRALTRTLKCDSAWKIEN